MASENSSSAGPSATQSTRRVQGTRQGEDAGGGPAEKGERRESVTPEMNHLDSWRYGNETWEMKEERLLGKRD